MNAKNHRCFEVHFTFRFEAKCRHKCKMTNFEAIIRLIGSGLFGVKCISFHNCLSLDEPTDATHLVANLQICHAIYTNDPFRMGFFPRYLNDIFLVCAAQIASILIHQQHFNCNINNSSIQSSTKLFFKVRWNEHYHTKLNSNTICSSMKMLTYFSTMQWPSARGLARIKYKTQIHHLHSI